jgi:hypothetical protein
MMKSIALKPRDGSPLACFNFVMEKSVSIGGHPCLNLALLGKIIRHHP